MKIKCYLQINLPFQKKNSGPNKTSNFEDISQLIKNKNNNNNNKGNEKKS